jgi:hypothetical protein
MAVNRAPRRGQGGNHLWKPPTSQLSGRERGECGTHGQHKLPTAKCVGQCARPGNVEPARKLLLLALPRSPSKGLCCRLRISCRYTRSIRIGALHRSRLMKSVDEINAHQQLQKLWASGNFRRGNLPLTRTFLNVWRARRSTSVEYDGAGCKILEATPIRRDDQGRQREGD